MRAGDSTHRDFIRCRPWPPAKDVLIRITAGQQQPHPPGVAQHHRADLQQLQPDRAHLRPRQFRSGQTQSPHRFQQHIRATGEQQPKLVGPPIVATGPVAEQAQLLFLDPVLHLARARNTLRRRVVGPPSARLVTTKRGLLPLVGVLRLDDHPPLPIPTSRRIRAPPQRAAAFLPASAYCACAWPTTAGPAPATARSWPARRHNPRRDLRTNAASATGKNPLSARTTILTGGQACRSRVTRQLKDRPRVPRIVLLLGRR